MYNPTMHLPSVPKVLRDKIIPYADDPTSRIIIARSKMLARHLPAGVEITKRAASGELLQRVLTSRFIS